MKWSSGAGRPGLWLLGWCAVCLVAGPALAQTSPAPSDVRLDAPAPLASPEPEIAVDPAAGLPWGGYRLVVAPNTLLWQPPLANQHEPQMFVRPTSLSNPTTRKTLDTAIGGTAPLVRLAPDLLPSDGVQLDFFAVVFSRFAGYNTLVDADYRFGLPITWASGDWQGKLAYEHTSSHIGDDYLRRHPEASKRGHIRDEMVCGLAYRFWDQLRVYGQFGYAMGLTTAGPPRRDRYDVGVEWSRQVWTGWIGQPFAAIDLDIRGDEQYTPNLTAQAGWQWFRPGALPYSMRVALTFYDGRSPYGQFFDRHEQWYGVGFYLDW
jgi:hypothetical protein